jgi:hypothetical protein
MNIDGVILSPEALEQLHKFQEEDNSLLNGQIKTLTEVVKFIVNESLCSSNNKERETLATISALFCLCDELKNLFAKEGDES